MIFFHIRHSKYYITTYLQAIYRDHYVTSNYRLYHWMRIVKSVLLEKKSEAYYFLRIWIAVSNYVIFTLITNEKCWLYDLLFHGWKLDLFFVKGKMRVPIPPIIDFTNFSKKRFLNKYFYFTIFFSTFNTLY